MEDKSLVNRVANSGLITINLEDFFPDRPIAGFDIKDFLFRDLILKEKDFREALKNHEWEQYQDQYLAIYCSTDAIVPVWAYMLIAGYAQPYCSDIFFGNQEALIEKYYDQKLRSIDAQRYQDKRIVIKGCSEKPVPISAYLDLTKKLRPFAQSIMYGEPCSTVPIFKRPRVLPKVR
ncbi:MAG: DUF2480 family protein [Saprospiraceae bacterium]|nr:DUF2480 family protein [Saprospiraceae bacterium]